jgi:putative addiction module component (TIGR02574 family)
MFTLTDMSRRLPIPLELDMSGEWPHVHQSNNLPLMCIRPPVWYDKSLATREALMTTAVEQLKSQAGTLTGPERADLAYHLLTSLEPEEEGAEAAWHEEISLRVAEIRNGQTVGRPAEEVLDELRNRYP